MPRALGMFLIVIQTSVTGLAAQAPGWGVAGEIGFSRFSGTSTSDSSGDTSFRPSPSTSLALRLDRNASRIGVAVTILYEKTGVMEAGDQVAVTVHDIVKLYAVRPELGFLLLRLGAGTLWAHGGISVERWRLAGEDPRYRFAGLGGLSINAPLGDVFSTEIRWEGSLSRSVLTRHDLPTGFSTRNTFHSRVGLGIRLGL